MWNKIKTIMSSLTSTGASQTTTTTVIEPPSAPDPLRVEVRAGQDGLANALRAMIESKVQDGTPVRNDLENALERARTALAADVKFVHLSNLAADLKLAVNILQAHTLHRPAALEEVKETLQSVLSAVTRHTPKPEATTPPVTTPPTATTATAQ